VTEPTARRSWPQRARRAASVLVPLVVFAALAFSAGSPWLVTIGRLGLAALAVVGVIWLARVAWRRVFWRVGRRLALSYFLVGVLPLVLVAALVLVAGYVLGGFLLGHVARDAIDELHHELRVAALARLGAGEAPPTLGDGIGRLESARYRRGLRVAGNGEAPTAWPAWLERRAAPGAHEPLPFVALADGTVSAAALAGDPDDGVLVWFEGDLAAALRQRTRTWLDLVREDDPRQLSVLRLQVFGRGVVLRGLWFRRDRDDLAEYYRLDPPADAADPGWLERPTLLWMESTGALPALATGEPATGSVGVSLAASPRGLFRTMLSVSAETDSTAWLALAGIGVLLFEIWVVAAALALFMVVGISRAVNRLSHATAAIGRGDFSFRIPARRRDQVGELQRSFNDMAGHLGELVETAAQKEALDKELALARAVQRDLLPDLIEPPPGVDLATTFEPSSAIGGDYFDILPRPGGRIAVVVADVAGHGLAAGLRMAMVKSALALLVEEDESPARILERLQRLLAARRGERSFVTLVFAELDPATGELTVTNAGHPPCYLVRRGGEVEELSLPGLPLGRLLGPPGVGRARLEPGDAAVWISDGIPECVSEAGEVYGYERVARALAGRFASAAELRDRLAEDLRRHCGEAPVEDDRTLVALRYLPPNGEPRPSRV
jgi:sigma-B regulation protein RsbU (phosphoserine phosphatase)